jgi:quercetin dioxygenase-like cupin family protein
MSVIHRFRGEDDAWDWEGVPVEEIGPGVTARRFISRRDGSDHLELRYFELQPGASSHYEAHNYEHAVLVLRGRGQVVLGEEAFDVGNGDAIFVPADEKHQFRASAGELFGFLCTVLDPEFRKDVYGEPQRVYFDEETA